MLLAAAARAGPPPARASGAASPAPAPPRSASPPLSSSSSLSTGASGATQPIVLHGVTCLRRLLSKESQPPVQEVLGAGILPRLVLLLDCGDAKVQFEAAWAITNIASTEFTAAVVDAGAVPPLVRCMAAADPNLREQSIWCIGNVAGESPALRDLLIASPGCVEALLQNLAYPGNQGLLRNATWTLSNLCRGKPSPSPATVAAMLPALAHLAASADLAVLVDALWGLSYLTDGDDKTIDAVVAFPGVVKRCVELMGHEALTVVTPALRIIGNLISGTDRQTQAAVDAHALRAIVPLLTNAKRNVRREACWAVSNVAAGTLQQISAMMLVPGLVQGVIKNLKTGEWNVRKEACWVVFNVATTGTPEHVRQLVAAEAVAPLAAMLECDDPRILCVALDAVAAVLEASRKLGEDAVGSVCVAFEEAGAVDALENLQSFSDADVYNKALSIIEKFFQSEEEEEEGGAGGGNEDDDTVPAAALALVQQQQAGGAGGGGAGFAFGGFGGSAPQASAAFGMGGPGVAFGFGAERPANAAAPGAGGGGKGFLTPPAAPAPGFSVEAGGAAPAFSFGAFSFS